MEVGAQDVQGLPLLAQPVPRQSYTPMAAKPAPSSNEPSCQWNQAPVTLIYQWKNKGGRGDEGKRMIQRLNEESGHQKNAVLSTWRWCKHCWLRLSQTSDRWPHPHSSLLTELNKFNIIKWHKWSHEPWYSANVWCSLQYFFKVLIYRHTFVFTFSAYVFGNGTLWCWWRAKALRTKETVFRKGLYSWLIY